MHARLLLVEDEPDLAEVVCLNLNQQGFWVQHVTTAAAALQALRADPLPQLILLDWMLPDQPGTEVCRFVRAHPQTQHIPVVLLTARGEEIDRVVGFELGVDDYVVKPFSIRELVLRIRVLLRVQSPAAQQPPARGMTLDLDGYRAIVHGEAIPLTERDAKLLGALVAAKGRVLSKEQLLASVWGHNTEVTTTALESHLKRLRRKLGPAGRCLKTLRGAGYSWSSEEP